MRTFDAVRLGSLECDGWAAYYRREWWRALRAFVGMVRVGFGMPWPHTVYGAWLVLRANQLWAPYPDNDPDACREIMTRFYALVRRTKGESFVPATAARYEVAWWAAHRARQRQGAGIADLERALTDLYAYVYAVPAADVREAAELRATAMDLSDRWVERGCHRDDPLLGEERQTLVASYTSLLAAVQ